MAKRVRDTIEVVVDEASRDPDHPAPRAFRWQGRRYEVMTVLGHWREDASYWAGRGLEVPQRDLWRVEARRGARPASSVFELVRETGAWSLHRVWD